MMVDHALYYTDRATDGSEPLARNTSPRLTARELQVLRSAALGNSNRQIALALDIADSTVRVLLWRAGKRFGVNTRSALIEAAVRFIDTASRYDSSRDGRPSDAGAL
jgi:DNA-binding CsgD family transcriptional regulator